MKTKGVLFIAILSISVAAIFAACGGGSSGGGGISAKEVFALYTTNGSNWNDYVKNDGADAYNSTGTACVGDETGGYDACIHGGEKQAVKVSGASICTGLSATDELGAFDWSCSVIDGSVYMVSDGLKDGKNLSDLLDFTAPGWKANSVTVTKGLQSATTESATWWSNSVTVDNDGGSLDAAGTIYVVTGTADLASVFTIDASKVGLVGQPGAIINGPGGGADLYVISADGSTNARDFLWIEGTVDATSDKYGVYLDTVRFSALRNVTAESAVTTGVWLDNSSNNALKDVTASNNNYIGVYLSVSNNNTLTDVTASNNVNSGVFLYSSSDNTLTDVTASNNGDDGVYLDTSSDNTLTGVTASNNGDDGIALISSSGNTLSYITASNNSGSGIYLSISTGNTLSEITASNNLDGVYLGSSSDDNMLSGVTTSNNFSGVYVHNSSSNNTLLSVTASNNILGVFLQGDTDNNTLMGVAASNNDDGVKLWTSSDNTLADVGASNNGYGVYLRTDSENNTFTGLLKVGNNATDDCEVADDVGAAPGLVAVTCTDNGAYGSSSYADYSSTATLYNGVTAAGSFVGKATSDDTVNTSDGLGDDAPGTATYPVEPDTFDWSSFENAYRGWGKDHADDFPSSNHRRQWTTGVGRIWDWSLKTGDTGDPGDRIRESIPAGPVLLGVLNRPTGDDTLTHTWSGTPATTDDAGCEAMVSGSRWNGTDSVCETTLLRRAVEIQGDGAGNENTLCETGETCLFTPNIGSYQGHGSLVDATDGEGFTAGTLTGITLMKYGTNGYQLL